MVPGFDRADTAGGESDGGVTAVELVSLAMSGHATELTGVQITAYIKGVKALLHAAGERSYDTALWSSLCPDCSRRVRVFEYRSRVYAACRCGWSGKLNEKPKPVRFHEKQNVW